MAGVTLDEVFERVNKLAPEDVVRLWLTLHPWVVKHYSPPLSMVLEEAKALPAEDQAELLKTLQLLLVTYSQPTEDEFEVALAKLGVLGDARPFRADEASAARQPIKLEGQPLSEQIIEERR